MRVIHGSAEPRRRSAIQAAYDEFRLDRQGELVSPRTLEYYDDRIGQFLAWLAEERPEVRRMQDLDVGVVREYRAYLSGRLTPSGRPIRPKTVAESHTALMTFLKWAKAEGYEVEPRALEFKRPRVPAQEPTVYHIAQLRDVLKACDPARPEEALAVRILIGSGVRESELCGLAVAGPDGLRT
jgi:integrase